MKKIRTELSSLLNSHDILECDNTDCQRCNRVKEIGQLLSAPAPRYTLTNRDGRIKLLNSSLEIQRFLRTGHEKIVKAIETGNELKCWTIKKSEGEQIE